MMMFVWEDLNKKVDVLQAGRFFSPTNIFFFDKSIVKYIFQKMEPYDPNSFA